MASSALRTMAFLLALNLLFFTLVSSQTLPAEATCPTTGLKFGVCAGFLSNLLGGIVVGTPPSIPCCNLIFGLVDLEAAACLCKAIKANLLGTNLDASASFNLVYNNCGKEVPSGFQCA
ncbi:14 kDa proline-rich protein DC2.15-like [Cynara cardunculus var. scolymus]|uniref:14 kDa proline-rich protein DC2.15-like n=1 Tax=Cynara cardunculus var. scolymus TaxID=59895 RepID=UPI000D623941|nr:14 kDa proline-rich protein DC2.15-like [Cynara cardunculus var. scolymus]